MRVGVNMAVASAVESHDEATVSLHLVEFKTDEANHDPEHKSITDLQLIFTQKYFYIFFSPKSSE